MVYICIPMELARKLKILADAAKYDASCASSGTSKRNSLKGKGIGSSGGVGICHSYTPDGRCVSLLKILMTNFCIYDCQYCINRKSSNTERARLSPDEIITLTINFYKRNYIEGLFLSSGIIRNSDYTMECLIKVAKTLRIDHDFRGYIHLKTIPEASEDLIKEAGKWADRLSINIELATSKSLKKLAPEKDTKTIHSSMGTIRNKLIETKEEQKKSRYVKKFAPAGQSTQMIIGADGESDHDILNNAHHLYNAYKMKRVYYSAFSPIPDPSIQLPNESPPLLREHRLYQADWLLRFYDFKLDEIVNIENKDLNLKHDPKISWAIRNTHFFPVDLNKATREEILRIPGIGIRNTHRILKARRFSKIRLNDLSSFRISIKKILPYIQTLDYTPKNTDILIERATQEVPKMKQMELFPERSHDTSAISGEL